MYVHVAILCLCVLKKMHIIRDTIWKRIRRAGKCDRAVSCSLSVSQRISVFLFIALCLYLSFSRLFFLTHIQDTDTVRDIFSQGRFSWAFFGPDSMNWSILGHFWNKQNFTNLQLLKIKKHFTIAILSEPCLWIWNAGASCCLLLTLFTREATWSLLLLFGSSFFL